MFGHCLIRLIHQIVVLRKEFSNKKILIRKEDLKSVYRRLHLHARSDKQSGVRVKIDEIWNIIISLRITFGGVPGPAYSCTFSDIVCDTIKDSLDCDSMSENEVCSEFKEFIPPEEKLNDNIPFGKALSLEVKVPVEKNGKFDVYIDDFIGVTVDINNNKSRLEKAPCTVIYAVSHTSVNNTFIPRKILIEKYKYRAERAL